MARQPINVLVLNGPGGTGVAPAPTWTDADAAEKNYWDAQEGDVLIARNGGGSTRIVDVYSTADGLGRQVDADSKSTFTLAVQGSANDKRYWGPFKALGWVQSGADQGRIFVDAPHADVKLLVIRGM